MVFQPKRSQHLWDKRKNRELYQKEKLQKLSNRSKHSKTALSYATVAMSNLHHSSKTLVKSVDDLRRLWVHLSRMRLKREGLETQVVGKRELGPDLSRKRSISNQHWSEKIPLPVKISIEEAWITLERRLSKGCWMIKRRHLLHQEKYWGELGIDRSESFLRVWMKAAQNHQIHTGYNLW